MKPRLKKDGLHKGLSERTANALFQEDIHDRAALEAIVAKPDVLRRIRGLGKAGQAEVRVWLGLSPKPQPAIKTPSPDSIQRAIKMLEKQGYKVTRS